MCQGESVIAQAVAKYRAWELHQQEATHGSSSQMFKVMESVDFPLRLLSLPYM